MKLKIHTIIFFFIALFFFNIGCKKECELSEDFIELEYSELRFRLHRGSATLVPSLVHPDSVKFYDSNLNQMDITWKNLNGNYNYERLFFYNSTSLDTEITNVYYIKINGDFTDTLRLIQKLSTNGCNRRQLDYFRIYVNDSLNMEREPDSDRAVFYLTNIYIH